MNFADFWGSIIFLLFFAGVPATDRLHGGDEGAAGDHGYQGQQDWSHQCKYNQLRPLKISAVLMYCK